MTTISAKVVEASKHPNGPPITTMRCHYPLCIHNELMTHRMFSRNSASSRAIPVKKMIEAIRADPFVPMYWGANQKGMQAGAEIDTQVILCVADFETPAFNFGPWTNEEAWLHAMERAIEVAEAFDKAGYHKQIINRLLAPWMHIDTLLTSTQWSNFLALRNHSAAEPHMHILARAVNDALHTAPQHTLQPGEWHLPYIGPHEKVELVTEAQIKVSVARCAHLSYETVEGKPIDIETGFRIYGQLLSSIPMHASPAEHQAQADVWVDRWKGKPHVGEQVSDAGWWQHPHQHGNFVGWRQYRKMLTGECQ